MQSMTLDTIREALLNESRALESRTFTTGLLGFELAKMRIDAALARVMAAYEGDRGFVIYAHRNGESEPPTTSGKFWFDGEGSYEPLSPIHTIRSVTYVTEESKGKRYGFCQDGEGNPFTFTLSLMDGRWHGPIVAPWPIPEKLAPGENEGAK